MSILARGHILPEFLTMVEEIEKSRSRQYDGHGPCQCVDRSAHFAQAQLFPLFEHRQSLQFCWHSHLV